MRTKNPSSYIASWSTTEALFGVPSKLGLRGGAEPVNTVNVQGSKEKTCNSNGQEIDWNINQTDSDKGDKAPVVSSYAKPIALDPNTFGIKWKEDWVQPRSDGMNNLPQYYKLGKDKQGKPRWVLLKRRTYLQRQGC